MGGTILVRRSDEPLTKTRSRADRSPLRRKLDGDDLCRRIQDSHVFRIGRDDAVSARSRAQDDGCVDHVGRSPGSAELTRLSRSLVIEGLDLHAVGTEQPREARLATPVAPHLSHGARRRRKRILELQRSGDERHDGSIIPIERDQCTSIERQAPHRRRFRRAGLVATPSRRSAARRSAVVRGPPVSANISPSKLERSSSLTFSSRAFVTYALTLAAWPRRTARRARSATCLGRLTASFSMVIPAV